MKLNKNIRNFSSVCWYVTESISKHLTIFLFSWSDIRLTNNIYLLLRTYSSAKLLISILDVSFNFGKVFKLSSFYEKKQGEGTRYSSIFVSGEIRSLWKRISLYNEKWKHKQSLNMDVSKYDVSSDQILCVGHVCLKIAEDSIKPSLHRY